MNPLPPENTHNITTTNMAPVRAPVGPPSSVPNRDSHMDRGEGLDTLRWEAKPLNF